MEALEILAERRISNYAVACSSADILSQHSTDEFGTNIAILPTLRPRDVELCRARGWAVRGLTESQDIEGAVIIDGSGFRGLMRLFERHMQAGCLVLPMDPDWVVPSRLRQADGMYAAHQTTAAANYVARCSLRGHYLEFGTFWGASFFSSFFQFRHWLEGDFYAFDSFCGLSMPDIAETEATRGDFSEGAYACNRASFEAIADLVQMDRARLKVVAGFYDESLQPGRLASLGLKERSVSVCYIDCDLRQPTELVLDYVVDLLEDGALIFFDDWRLCKASRQFGERAAALAWLERNPNCELVEFTSTHWQNQWFIFQRR